MLKLLQKTSRDERGFTLTELLVVVVILGILATVAIPRVLGAIDTARESKALADIRVIVSGLERHYFDKGYYPLRLGELRGKYLKSDFDFKNSHGHLYFYAVNYVDAGSPLNFRQFILGNPSNPLGDVATTDWWWDGVTQPVPARPEGLNPATTAYYWYLGATPPTDPLQVTIDLVNYSLTRIQSIPGASAGQNKPTRPDLQYD